MRFVFHILVLALFAAANGSCASSSPTVIIVGAGMSGIMAAKTLSDNGVTDILILEATDRIGGRMRQHNISGYMVEVGANWVEGVGGDEVNPIWTLANEFDMRMFYTNTDNISRNIYDQEGNLIPASTAVPAYDKQDELFNFTYYMGVEMNDEGQEDISILTAQRLFGPVPSTPLDMVIDYSNFDCEFAEPPRVTSLKNAQPNPTFENYGEDLYFVADSRGYVHLVFELAKTFLSNDNYTIKDSRLLFEKVATKIQYDSDGVTVETEDGSVYNATYAVISPSIGVMQSDLITFEPDLPLWKIMSFFQFDMSVYTKIFVKFPRAFWPTGPGTQVFLYAADRRGYYPVWQHFEEEYSGSYILLVTVTDTESRRIEQQPDEETAAEIMVILRKMFGDDIPDCENILVPRWWTNRFFRGAFSNWPIGMTRADFDRMKAPLGNLYFTGEHTHELYNGYVHGAYLAGLETAEFLLNCMNNGTCFNTTADGNSWEMAKDGKEGFGDFESKEEKDGSRHSWEAKLHGLEKSTHKKHLTRKHFSHPKIKKQDLPLRKVLKEVV